jgi:hypothetical protein
MIRIEVEKTQKIWKSMSTPPANDKRLSFKARGILYYIYTKPEGWKGQIYDLVDYSEKDGITAIKSAMKELVKYGYARLVKERDSDGKIHGSFYRIFELPHTNNFTTPKE